MDAQARRQQIMQKLWRQKHASIVALAKEFGVSERTIQRDIDVLSLTEPIYIEKGRYGGVRLVEGIGYKAVRIREEELAAMRRIVKMSVGATLTKEEIDLVRAFLLHNGEEV